MKRKKILYVGNALSHSGATVTTIETLSTQLRSEGFDVQITSQKRNKMMRMLDMLWTVFQNRASVDAVLIDTYSTMNFWYAVAVATMCRRWDLPYFPILHGGNLPDRLQKSPKASRKLFGNAKMNVAPSDYLYTAFAKADFSNTILIPNTIPLEQYPFKKRELLVPKLLWVRSFASIYNPLLAIKVLEKLLVTYPSAQLCMVGPEKDESFEVCKNYVVTHKLPVTFTGKLSKKEWIALSSEYDIFLNTTNFDNMPVSIIEAMALGLPIVSTNVGGIPSILDDGETAVLVPKEHLDKMVTAVFQLLRDPKKAMAIASAARERVTQYDWDIVKIKWNELLSSKI